MSKNKVGKPAPAQVEFNMNEFLTVARNSTQLVRLQASELEEAFASLKAAGYEVRKV